MSGCGHVEHALAENGSSIGCTGYLLAEDEWEPCSEQPDSEVLWRTGRKVGRTIYRDDVLVGLMDTPELAVQVVDALNAVRGER